VADAGRHQQVPAQHHAEHPQPVGQLRANPGVLAGQQRKQAGIEQGVLGIQYSRREAGGKAPAPRGRGRRAGAAGGAQGRIRRAGVADQQYAQVGQVRTAARLQRVKERAVGPQRGKPADGQGDEHAIGGGNAQA